MNFVIFLFWLSFTELLFFHFDFSPSPSFVQIFYSLLLFKSVLPLVREKRIWIPIFVSLLLVFTYIYFSSIRWGYEPFGMWDSWSNWNLKAKLIFAKQSVNRSTSLPLLESTRPDYPLFGPFLVVGLMHYLGFWHDQVLRVFSLGMLFFTALFYLQNIQRRAFAYVFVLLLFLQFPYFQMVTDLCMDFLLSIVILVSVDQVFFQTREKRISDFHLGILLLLPLLIKKEGILLTFFLLTIFILKIPKKEILSKRTLWILTGACFPILFFQLSRMPHEAFQDYHWQAILLPELWLPIFEEKLPFLKIYQFQYFFLETQGIWIFGILYLLLQKQKNLAWLGLFYLLILICYDLVYLFTNHNISWHLATSYVRIHTTILPAFLYSLGKALERTKFKV